MERAKCELRKTNGEKVTDMCFQFMTTEVGKLNRGAILKHHEKSIEEIYQTGDLSSMWLFESKTH